MSKIVPASSASLLIVSFCAALSTVPIGRGVLAETPPLPPPAGAPPALDDGTPKVTPGIRPRKDGGKTEPAPPDLAPERKAEPRDDAKPAPKRADPAPKSNRRTDPKAPDPKSAEPKPGDPKAPGKPKIVDKNGKEIKPGLLVAQPRSAAERDKALSDLYALLATAEDERQAETIAASIERLWNTPGSDTISYLMNRAILAAEQKNPELALKLLDAVVALAPDYAEGWNRRAYVHYTQNHVDLALGDLRRTLALDANHFKAMDGLIHILQEIDRKKEALQAARKLLEIDPFYEGAKQLVDELSREVEDRGI